MSSLQQNPIAARQNPTPLNSEEKQRRLMRIALALLCSALLVVLLKNWEFWSNMISPETVATDTVAPDEKPSTDSAKATTSGPPLARSIQNRPAVKTSTASLSPLSPVITATNRTVLPPLEIQVVSGNREQNVRTSNRSIQVDLAPAQNAGPSKADGITADASERLPISTDGSSSGTSDSTGLITRKVQPNYPMLAKQMKIQGAVVLEALIGRDGDIQHLRVVTGPTILAAAAREAVKQWHFKPYLAAGKAVETEARITVNFTISAD